MVRKPVVAGMFYEKGFEALDRQIKDCFLKSPGPGSLPKERKNTTIKGAIIPHAGYIYSGYCAAHAYKAIAESKFPDVFILIGPNHTGLGNNSVLLENMSTPFGEVSVDMEFAKALVKNSGLIDDKLAHMREHSLEVHLPFLQFTAKDRLKDLKVVPIVIYECDTKRLAVAIRNTAIELNKSICIIASSDFVHYGPNFSYMPFRSDVKSNIEKLDLKAYDFIKRKDADGFLDFTDDTGATICGKYPIAVLLNAVEGIPELLSHYSSGEIAGDYTSCVDYMAIIIK